MNLERYITLDRTEITSNDPRDNDKNNPKVVTSEILRNEFSTIIEFTFKKTALIKKDFNPTTLPIKYHFTTPLHILKDKSNQEDKTWLNKFLSLENYQEDERIFFIKGE